MEESDKRFWRNAAIGVGLCVAAVVVIGFASTRYGGPDTVPLLRLVDQKWIVLYEADDGSDENPGFDRLVVIDARTSRQLALEVVDAKPLSVSSEGVMAWARNRGFYRWSLPELKQTLDPAAHAQLVPALAAGLADESPCVDRELDVVRVLTKAGDHVTLSLTTGLPASQQARCNRLHDPTPRPLAFPASFVRMPASERFTLAGAPGAAGWLDPQAPVVDLGISPDLAVVHPVAVGGPLALSRVTPTGATRWTTNLGELRHVEHALPASGALVLSGHGLTFGVDLETGAVRWKR